MRRTEKKNVVARQIQIGVERLSSPIEEEVSEEDEDDDEDEEEEEETEEALDPTAARRAKRSLNRRVATPRRRPDGSSTFRRPDVTGRRVVVQKAGSEHDGVGGAVDASAHGYSRVLTDDGASLHLRRHEFRLVDDNGDGLTDERPRKRPPRPRPASPPLRGPSPYRSRGTRTASSPPSAGSRRTRAPSVHGERRPP